MSDDIVEPSNVTSASAWKQDAQKGVELPVPSGKVALVKPPGGMKSFIQKGMLPNALMPIVEQALKTGEEPDLKQLAEDAQGDMSLILDMLSFQDQVVLDTVILPAVYPVPLTDDGDEIPPADRDQSKLYIDEVDFEDRTFIYQYAVGGTRDLERFREERQRLLELVSPGQDVASSAE